MQDDEVTCCAHLTVYCRYREHPIFVIIVLSGIMSILKSYPSIGDAALCLGLLPVHDELFKCKRAEGKRME